MADDPRTPVERAKQVTFWVLAVAAVAFWLLAMVETRSIIGPTVATLAVVLLYTVLAVVARRFELGSVERAVQWVLERGWREPKRTFRLATADLRSAVHPSATGRARACPQQRLDFAPATLAALERTIGAKTMAGLATDAFSQACKKRKAVLEDARPVQVVIGSDPRLGVGRWSCRYIPEGGLPEPPHPTSRPGPGRPGRASDSPTKTYDDFEPTRTELDASAGATLSFSTLTLTTGKDEHTVTPGAPVTVGRESTCDIVLPSPDKKIHRHHATITYRPDGCWWLVPEGDHGVRVGQTHHGPGDAVALSDGDTVAWGKSSAALRSQVRIS